MQPPRYQQADASMAASAATPAGTSDEI